MWSYVFTIWIFELKDIDWILFVVVISKVKNNGGEWEGGEREILLMDGNHDKKSSFKQTLNSFQ